MHELATGARHRLAPGASASVDGAVVRCQAAGGAGLDLEALASALAGADTPDDVVRRILDASIAAARADTGAVILADGNAYAIALAIDAAGAPLDSAAELLSDTIVRDVLGTSERVCLTNVGAHARYARVPSVVSLHLASVLCLPMRVDGRTLGALFLGKRDARATFGDRVVADLEVLAAVAVPMLAQLRRVRDVAPAGDDLLGDSDVMARVRNLIARVAPTDLSVLVLGASGTGKELVARAIHAASPRANRPLVALNCASVAASLLDAELFGYRKGAFTGAATDRAGLIEAAHGSTLFLDEVGDMPLPMQAALLRVLEQREVRRLGETAPRAVDFRLIAATNRDLTADVAAGTFREDLLFRLQEMTVELPPLSARAGDVELLATLFLRQAETQLGLSGHALGADALAALRAHPWPGNVRELRATMRRAAVLATASTVTANDLQLTAAPATESTLGDLDRPLADARDDFVARYARAVLDRHGGDRDAAAKALQIGVRSLYRYLA